MFVMLQYIQGLYICNIRNMCTLVSPQAFSADVCVLCGVCVYDWYACVCVYVCITALVVSV